MCICNITFGSSIFLIKYDFYYRSKTACNKMKLIKQKSINITGNGFEPQQPFLSNFNLQSTSSSIMYKIRFRGTKVYVFLDFGRPKINN